MKHDNAMISAYCCFHLIISLCLSSRITWYC